MVKTLGELYQQYEVTIEEEEAWAMKQKTELFNDYSAPLLAMKRMLADYEKLLIERRWNEATAMSATLITQARILTQTVRVQAEEQCL